jgi:ketosteroid isomerase-like protein
MKRPFFATGDNMIDRTAAFAITNEFLRRFSAMDFDGLRALLVEDVVASAPYSTKNLRLSGQDEVLGHFSSVVRGFVRKIVFTVETQFFDPERQTAVVEFNNRGERTDGRPYENQYIWIFGFRDDRIASFKVYFNPSLIS